MTATKESASKNYYYAGGEKVELDLVDEYRAIDVRRVRRGTKLRRKVDEIVRNSKARTYKTVSIVPADALPAELEEELSRRGAFQPLFRRDDAMIVFLPEVRIEEDRPEYKKKIRSLLKRHEAELTVDQRSYKANVKPKSGRGVDALELANEIQEEVSPDYVQARMLRITPRPKYD